MTQYDQKKLRRFDNPDTNPCLTEATLSMKCLERHHYNNNKCLEFFNSYNTCKVFWNNIMKHRKTEGIKPEMPNEKERKLIMIEREKGNTVYAVKVDEN